MDIRFIIYLILNISLSGTSSFLFASFIIKNNEAMNLIANTFSILSGFLFIVITVIGELAIFQSDDSSYDKIIKFNNFETRFTRFSVLFILYLTVLFLLFINFLIRDVEVTKISFLGIYSEIQLSSIKLSLAHCIVFMSTFCFLASARLPWVLKRLIQEKNSHK
ncbi:hypothetical protein KRX11_10145 [Pasteurellaceae bacterium TAE3-ERU1]|nr:hypothetical protein [Pasteurellaceae bacterium TAE3-ERU1]